MPKPRGRSHTTLTETATLVVRTLEKLPAGTIKMIAPGEIRTTQRGKAGRRHVTAVTTPAGLELIITGQSVQKVAVHTTFPRDVTTYLKSHKSLREFSFSARTRDPGI